MGEPRRRRAKSRVALATVAVGAVLLTSCGSDTAAIRDDPDGFSIEEAFRSAGQESAATFTTSSYAAEVDLSLQGEIDEAANLMAANVQLPVSNDNIKVDVVFDSAADLLYVDTTNLPNSTTPTKWMGLVMSKSKGKGFSLDAIARVNPFDVIDMLAASSDVRTVGLERLDGIDVKHFVVTVPTDKAVPAHPGLFVDLPGSALAEIPSIDYDVWITRDSQVHSMSFSFEMFQTPVEFDMSIVEFGPVDSIARPADAEVTMVGGASGS